jgi:uncharacterized membrane-anchored protein
MIRRVLFWAGLALVLATINWQIAAKQSILDHGVTMLVPLRPVDPRSLMQGDYMALRYADPLPNAETAPERWVMVVTLEDDVIHFRHLDDGKPLAAGEHRLAYRRDGSNVLFAADSFLFQEGQADRYARARYAVLKVADNGTALLHGLADAERKEIEIDRGR